MIYLDSSALMKLVRAEAETEALQEWLTLRPEQPIVTSAAQTAGLLVATPGQPPTPQEQ